MTLSQASPQTRFAATGSVTLALGTGLLKCAASLGLYRMLQREQIPIREVIASSAGAIFGASIGLGKSDAEIQAFLGNLVSFYGRARVSRLRWLQMGLPKLLGFNETFGIGNDRTFARMFRQYFGQATFQDLSLPLTVVATNFATGERVLLERGLLWEAICATCTPLVLLPPRSVGGQLLIDGAICQPLPTSVAAERGAKIVITLGFENPYLNKMRNLSQYANHFRNMLVNQLLNAQNALSGIAYPCEVIPLVPKFGAMINQSDSERFAFITQKGQEAAELMLPYLRSLLPAQTEPVA
jgi:NTE family protein